MTRSDEYGGYWIATDYEHVLQVAQDWQTFSSELGISVPAAPPDAGDASAMKIYPVTIDPPLQRTFKRLINTYFTAAAVSVWEAPTRELVHRLIDGSFVCIARTTRHDTELAGNPVKRGEPVLIYWAAANRDEAEFENPDAFDLERPRNRHLAFGAGPHRCAGSNLARMNLRVALEEIAARLHDVELQPDAEIHYHSTFNRAPLSVPITFRPGVSSAG